MLHAAMSAFANIHLHPAESTAAQPHLMERWAAVRDFRQKRAGRPRFFVTKRGFSWFTRPEIDTLITRARREIVGILHIVRDPRDVLLSQHKLAQRQRYVSADHWRQSIKAADIVEDAVRGYAPFVTIRYEDFVRSPRAIERTMADVLGLTLRPGAAIDRVADSLASSGMLLSPYMKAAMQGVRNADPASIGKWRHSTEDPCADLAADPATARVYRAFLDRFGYAAAPLPA